MARRRTPRALQRDASPEQIASLLQAHGLQRAGRLRGQSGIERLRLATGSDPQATAAILGADPSVDFAEPNYLITSDEVTPNDPHFSEQWALRNTGTSGGKFGADINIAQGWERTIGSRMATVAVIDSGIDLTHSDLRANRWNNTKEFDNNLDDDGDGYTDDRRGWDFVTNMGEITDEHGHGTNVAGIIAASGQNGLGITGVMWRASLMSLRVLDSTGTGDIAHAVEAIDYAVAHGVKVINCSWGADDNSIALSEAIKRAATAGIPVVASAGNSGRDVDAAPRYPASYNFPNLISVASTDNSDLLTSWSNWGATRVTIAAPGKDILTTKAGGGYHTVSGSSASAPFVTGVVGLVKSVRPFLSSERTRELIVSGARQVPSLSGKVSAGGVINAAATLAAIDTLRFDEGLTRESGETSGDGTSGSQGASLSPGAVGANGHLGDGGNNNVTPLERTQGAPGVGLPNLNELRNRQPVVPRAPAPIPSTRCSHKNPDCTSRKNSQAANESSVELIALGMSLTPAESLIDNNSDAVSDSPFKLFGASSPSMATLLPQPQSTRTNVALASNGATASASSFANGFAPSGVINGDRKGVGLGQNGYWSTASSAFPAWIEINFGGLKTINEVDVFNIQNNYSNPAEPTETMTFSLYGLTGYKVQYWTGSSWVDIPGASVSNNNLVWNKFTFADLTTNRIRVLTSASLDGYSRATEVEAWGTDTRTNVALSSNEATASASSEHDSGSYPANKAINGNRSGSAGLWNDNTQYVYPDWLQVNFQGSKTIDKIDIFTLQDNYQSPSEPTATMTFSQYGVTAFDVQYWTGSAWATVPGGSITGNNLVWRKVTFPPVTTDRVRILVNNSLLHHSRITGVEAWGVPALDLSGDSYSKARIDPVNRTGQSGVDLLSGNANWSLPILGLKGRAGLDLGLSLSYNSLVWTKDEASNSIKFDADQGMPSPGFRLGFPVVQPRYYNSQVGRYAYLLITPSGSHVELRQVGTSNVYEAADSSYLQLTDNGNGSLTLRPTDGSQLSYNLYNGQYQCTQIKDRNGNFISISYHADGRINTIADTLTRPEVSQERVINFVYDSYLNLNKITQTRTVNGQQQSHDVATFGWGDPLTINTSFSGLTVIGPQNNMAIPVLRQVGLDDGTRYNFDYTSWGQVYKIRHYAQDNHLLNWVGYNLPGSEWVATSSQTDCPRFTEQKVWAENWNGLEGVPSEVVTQYSTAPDKSYGQAVMPDDTIYKETFSTSGWERGLTTRMDIIVGGASKKWTTILRTQDDTNLQYQKNPRVTETNIYDFEGNRKRTTINYGQYAAYGLPFQVDEYAADGSNVLRSTYTNYNLSQDYLNHRIIGLVSSVEVKVGQALQSKVTYAYDAGDNQPVATEQNTTQHDASYGTGSTPLRGLLTSVTRHDVTGASSSAVTQIGYDTNGSVVFTKDPLGRETKVSYNDSFSDGNNARNTYAYPTKVTPPLVDGENPASFSSISQYDYYIGTVTRTQGPAPAGHTEGAIQTFEYDAAGRITRVNNLVNDSYKRWVYGSDGAIITYTTVQTGSPETFHVTYLDGVGRLSATGTDHPNSVGMYRGQYTYYDKMGRASKTSNPGEMTDHWIEAGEDAAGWVWTLQQYDWKGRPTITTNPDGTTKVASYGGCGCAGGEEVIIKDEVGRRQRLIADVLGRPFKTQTLDWNGDVYSTVTNNYNARDQVTSTVEEAASSGATQTTTLTYDGHGRLKTKQAPSQTAATQYAYNADDTVQTVTDARGVVSTFLYNNRRLLTGITYSEVSGIAETSDVTFTYDAVGNRTSMTDGSGRISYSYDRLSRLTSESRQFDELTGTFSLSYSYNLAGELTGITDPTGAAVNYSYDHTGRMTGITGSSFAGITQYASNMLYRAWGGLKSISYGNGRALSVQYNSRLQASRFDIPGVITKEYQYYADGSLRYSQDLRDQKFDRSYAYDHVGRITQALSGIEARGGQSVDGRDRPYNESFSYNPMNHLTGRMTHNWDEPYSLSDQYVNDRNTAWSYDADGRVLENSDVSYVYDAAGSVISFGDFIAVKTEQSADGEGRRVRSEQWKFNESAGTWQSERVTYYVTSSVLGGRVVTELNYDGGKRRTFVHAGGSILAWQWKGSGGAGDSVNWEHRDASGASFRATISSGNVVGESVASYLEAEPQELDPSGADAGLHAPLILPPPEEGTGELLSYPRMSSPGRPGTTYAMDGIPVSVNDFMQAIESRFASSLDLAEFAARSSSRAIGYRNSGVRWGRPFEVTYDTNGRMTSMNEWGFDPSLAGVNYGNISPIYGSASWSLLTSLVATPQKPSTPATPYSQKRIRESIDHCTRAYFNIRLESFKPTTVGGIGKFTGFSLDMLNPWTIENDARSYSKAELGQFHKEYGRGDGSPVGGLTLHGPASSAAGFSVFRNYTANDISGEDPKIKGLTVQVGTQIWELGNSLNRLIPNNRLPFGQEAGEAFMECVQNILKYGPPR